MRHKKTPPVAPPLTPRQILHRTARRGSDVPFTTSTFPRKSLDHLDTTTQKTPVRSKTCSSIQDELEQTTFKQNDMKNHFKVDSISIEGRGNSMTDTLEDSPHSQPPYIVINEADINGTPNRTPNSSHESLHNVWSAVNGGLTVHRNKKKSGCESLGYHSAGSEISYNLLDVDQV